MKNARDYAEVPRWLSSHSAEDWVLWRVDTISGRETHAFSLTELSVDAEYDGKRKRPLKNLILASLKPALKALQVRGAIVLEGGKYRIPNRPLCRLCRG